MNVARIRHFLAGPPRRIPFLSPLLALSLAANLTAGQWPQYRGPNHDGTSTDRIQPRWPAEGPRVVWRTPLPDGFSSFAVHQGKLYTLILRAVGGTPRETCVALDATTGQELWATPLESASYDVGGETGARGNRGGDGPRSTPSVDGDRVFVLTGHLLFYCLRTADGGVVWKKDLPALYNAQHLSWQNAASPLIDGDLVFLNANAPNQCLMAFHKATGALVWKKLNHALTHATPVAATIQGVRQIIFLTQPGLVSVKPDTGALLWQYPFPYNTSTAASPVVVGDLVYCSAGYGIGAAVVRIHRADERLSVTEVWRSPNQFMNHWSTPVHHEGYLYGLFGHAEFATAPLQCLELATGNLQWSQPGFGPGGVIVVDGKILVLGDAGQLVLVEPNPNAYTEIARFQALAGKCWNVPAVADGRLYARSTKEGVCLDVAARPPAPLRLRLLSWNERGQCWLCLENPDGSTVEPERLPRLSVHASTDLNVPLAAWIPLPNALVLSNGLLALNDPAGAGLAHRYYLVREEP